MDKTPIPYEVRQIISNHYMRDEVRRADYVESGCLDAPQVIPCGSVDASMVGNHRVVSMSSLWRA